MNIWIIVIAVMIASFIIQQTLQSKFRKYSQIPTPDRLTGAEVASKMLKDNGITNVRVTCVQGELTDHFNPETMTVNLSQDVYGQRSIAAAAVAAHECGHAVQHATGYLPVKLRSALVPVISVTNQVVPFVLLGGMLLINVFPQLIWVGIGLFALTTLFTFVTLPVEIDASRRALAWLSQSDIIDPSNEDEARGALRAAAYTYVVAALSSLATLLYYLSIASGRRN